MQVLRCSSEVLSVTGTKRLFDHNASLARRALISRRASLSDLFAIFFSCPNLYFYHLIIVPG